MVLERLDRDVRRLRGDVDGHAADLTTLGAQATATGILGIYYVADYGSIQAAIDAVPAAGGVVQLGPGTTTVRPTTAFGLVAKANLTLRGAGAGATTIQVASDAGNWGKLIHGATAGTDLSGLTIEDITFDGNAVANAGATIAVADPTTHQVAIYVAGGDGVRVRRCRFLTAGLNTVVLGGGGARMEIADCQFVFTMRSGNAQYDNSAIYTVARDVTIAGNQFSGDSLTTAGKGATTAIETHGGTTTIVGNTCRRFMNMANLCTGSASGGAVTFVGNTAQECNWGVQVWPIDSPGFDGLTIAGNAISLSQVAHNQNNSAGIKVVDSSAATQPLRNVVIANNTIRFVDEGAGRTVDYASAAVSTVESAGIGIRARGSVTNLEIVGNTIELAPGRGIVLGQAASAPTYGNVRIVGNVILNPGQNLGINLFQRHGISIFETLTDVTIADNLIKDDFVVTRCTYDIFAAPGAGTFTRVTACRNLVPPATTPLSSSYDTTVLRWDEKLVPTTLKGSATWDPASLATLTQDTKAITVTGAAVGDLVGVSFNIALAGMTLTAYVSAADTVTAVLFNGTAGTLNLGSGTVRAAVYKMV